MYTTFLSIHSYVRWLVLLFALMAVARGVSGLIARRPWLPGDETAGRWFVISLDVQALIGIVLYVFLSPFTIPAWTDLAGTMRNAPARFIAIEHVTGMIVALAFAHAGRVRIAKATNARRRHLLMVAFFGLALLAIAISIPWPGMPSGRPLFRGL
jgi:hypothetical protein